LSIDLEHFLLRVRRARGPELYFSLAHEAGQHGRRVSDSHMTGKLAVLRVFLLHTARLLEGDPDPDLNALWMQRIAGCVDALFSKDNVDISAFSQMLD
jgi:hypothetical protein